MIKFQIQSFHFNDNIVKNEQHNHISKRRHCRIVYHVFDEFKTDDLIIAMNDDFVVFEVRQSLT